MESKIHAGKYRDKIDIFKVMKSQLSENIHIRGLVCKITVITKKLHMDHAIPALDMQFLTGDSLYFKRINLERASKRNDITEITISHRAERVEKAF
jgi:hypothetical protein